MSCKMEENSENKIPILIIKKSKMSKAWVLIFMILVPVSYLFLMGTLGLYFGYFCSFIILSMQVSSEYERYTKIFVFKDFFVVYKKTLSSEGAKFWYKDIAQIDAIFKIRYRERRYFLNFIFRNDKAEKQERVVIQHNFHQRELRPFFDIIESHNIPVTIKDTTFDVTSSSIFDREAGTDIDDVR